MKKTFYSFLILFLFLFQIQARAQGWTKLVGTNGLQTRQSSTICIDPSGNIYVAGALIDDSGSYYVAKYDGITWSELGGVNALHANGNGWIYTICSDPAGNIYAGVGFVSDTFPFTGHYYVAKYNGSAWSELGGTGSLGANDDIDALCADKAGNIYATGSFSEGASSSYGDRYVAEYNGTAWSKLGDSSGQGTNTISSLCIDKAGNIYGAGSMTYVTKYDGTIWSSLGGPNGLDFNDQAESICCDPAGNIYVAGDFKNASSNYYVAKYDGTSWSEVGGLNGLAANSYIESICADAAGNIYAAGFFTNSSGNRYVAVYNGTSWSELGGPNSLDASKWINCICADSSGDIYAVPDDYVEKYTPKAAGIIEMQTENGSISIYPNPASNQLTIQSSSFHNEAVTVSIMNVLGEIIQEEKAIWSNDIDMNIKNLSAGIYFLEMKTERGSVVKKFVKE